MGLNRSPRPLTARQQEVYDLVQTGSKIVHRKSTKTTIRGSTKIAFNSVEWYELRSYDQPTQKIDPRIVTELVRRKLIVVLQETDGMLAQMSDDVRKIS